MCSEIKPKETFQKEELDQVDSEFKLAFTRIKAKSGSKILMDMENSSLSEQEMRKRLSIKELRQRYKKELVEFSSHSYLYVDHYIKRL